VQTDDDKPIPVNSRRQEDTPRRAALLSQRHDGERDADHHRHNQSMVVKDHLI
jgi:hypothetical protein